MKRDDGDDGEVDEPKSLTARTVPSGELEVVCGSSLVMTELRGRPRPRIPSKLNPRGSESTVVAAAEYHKMIWNKRR